MSKSNSHLVLLCGNDESRVFESSKDLIARWQSQYEPNDTEVIDFQSDRDVWNAALESLRTLSLFGATKILWLKHFPGSHLKKADEQNLNLLCQTLEAVNPESLKCLISTDKLGMSSKLYALVSRKGQVETFDLLGTDKKAERTQVTQYISKLAMSLHKSINVEAVNSLIERCGANFSLIHTEVEKLSLYTSDRPKIDLSDVEAISSGSNEIVFWKLRDAIGSRNSEQAIDILNRLIEQGEYPVQLLASIIHTVQDLSIGVKLKEAWGVQEAFIRKPYWEIDKMLRQRIEEFKAQPEATVFNDILRRHPYGIYQLLRFSVVYVNADFQQMIGALEEADRLIKTSSVSPRVILQRVLILVMGASETVARYA